MSNLSRQGGHKSGGFAGCSCKIIVTITVAHVDKYVLKSILNSQSVHHNGHEQPTSCIVVICKHCN